MHAGIRGIDVAHHGWSGCTQAGRKRNRLIEFHINRVFAPVVSPSSNQAGPNSGITR